MFDRRTGRRLYSSVLTATLATGCTLANEPGTPQRETRTILGQGTAPTFYFDRTTEVTSPVAGTWEMKANVITGPSDVVMSKIDLAIGACVPWHRHSGAILVIFQAGTGTNYLPTADGGCTVETVQPGTATVNDGMDVHSLCNEGPDDLVTVLVTYVVPQGVPTNLAVPNPGTCPGGAP